MSASSSHGIPQVNEAAAEEQAKQARNKKDGNLYFRRCPTEFVLDGWMFVLLWKTYSFCFDEWLYVFVMNYGLMVFADKLRDSY